MAVKGDGRCSLPPFTFLKLTAPIAALSYWLNLNLVRSLMF